MIILGTLSGAALAVMEGTEPCLDENLISSAFIPDMSFFIQILIIYIFIGTISGWAIWFCISGIYRNFFR